MAIYDISEVNNAVQITKDGNFDQVQKGYYQISDPTVDTVLYIVRDGNQKYKINTDTDTITVNSAPFVGDSNDLKDTINSFFFNASSVAGGAQTLSNVIIQEDVDTSIQPIINQGNEGSVGLSLTVTISDVTKEDIIVLGHFSSIIGSAGNSELTFRTYINNVLVSETDPYRIGNTAQSLDFRTTSLRPLNAAGVFTLDVRVFAVVGNITVDNTDGSRIEVAQNKSVTVQSGSGGGSTAWGGITGNINDQTDLPYTVTDTIDANFKGDVYASGDFFAQANSIVFENQLSLGASGTSPFFSNLDTGSIAFISGSKVENSVSLPPSYLDRFNPFTKNDPNGQPQPDDSLTFNATPFVETLSGENKYYYAVTLTSTGTFVTDIWYIRSLTGITNSYLKAYKGVETDPNSTSTFWKTNTDKQIKEKTGLVSDIGGAGIDITYLLGNSFIESTGDQFTYIFIADNNFTVQGQNFGVGVDIPYIKGDGSEWRESTVSSNSNSYSFQKDYDFESNTTDSDPNGGKLKFNNVDLNIATFMYISQFAKNSVDNDSILSTLTLGDCLMVENTQNASNKVKWCLTSNPVKSGAYYKLEGSASGVSGAFANQMNLITTFFLNEQPTFESLAQSGTPAEKEVIILGSSPNFDPELRQLTNEDILGLSESLIVVKQASDFGTIDSSKVYLVDGVVDMGSTSLEVPVGGINIVGHNFNVSKLISSENNYTLFTSPVGGSGDLLFKDFAIEVTGTSSQVYDVKDSGGFHAYEIARINFNSCTSLGEIDGYRQGFETGTGRFGGQPQLTLSGTWLGGYFIDSSIVRSLVDGSYYLFKEGTSFVMNSRFRSNQNIDLNTTVGFFDFQPSNFTNENTVQLVDCIISRNGTFDPVDSTIIPNIDKGDDEAYFKGNTGILNTYVGGRITVTSESATVIGAGSTFYDLNATWTSSNLEHYDSPVNGELRHTGINPIEFNLITDLVLESTSNNVLEVRFAKWVDSSSSWVYFGNQKRQVNSLVGGRDVAFFNMLNSIRLEKNDKIKLQVANNNGNNNVTAEIDSFLLIQER
jgi:hypothetical protein